jgi:hypothetical protein
VAELDGIPEEVREMSEAFLRVCHKHHISVTGFMFRGPSATSKAFISMVGTITDRGEKLRALHEDLLDFIERSGVKPTVLKRNDA